MKSSHLTVVTVVAWAAHGVPGAALSALLALKARATGKEAELLATTFRVSRAHERLREAGKVTSRQTQTCTSACKTRITATATSQ